MFQPFFLPTPIGSDVCCSYQTKQGGKYWTGDNVSTSSWGLLVVSCIFIKILDCGSYIGILKLATFCWITR